MKMKLALRLLAGAAIVVLAASCASTPFSEKTSSRDGELTSFEEITLDSVVTLEDLANLGKIKASRTVTYNLQASGDYTIEMGDYKYTYTFADGSNETTGTRVIGTLNNSSAGAAGGTDLALGGADGGFFSGLLGGLMGGADSGAAAPAATPSVATMGPKTIAMDAVKYDLINAAVDKGGMAVLLPDYSWEIEEEITGTDNEGFLFIAPSRTYETKTLVYTVTATATAVSF